MNSFQVAIAAEAYVAAILAEAGCDVSIQYGANQPEYDLIATRDGCLKKISVKGSKDGGWVLAAGFKRGRTYHEAVDAWVDRHADQNVIYAFVQFYNSKFMEMPRIYFCTIKEAGDYLKTSRGGHGYTSLREHFTWSRGLAKGSIDKIPDHWKATKNRITDLIIGPKPST